MYNKLISDLLEDAIERLTELNAQIKKNHSYHMDDKVQKEHADNLRDVANILDPPVDMDDGVRDHLAKLEGIHSTLGFMINNMKTWMGK